MGFAMTFLVENGVGKLQSIEPPPADLSVCLHFVGGGGRRSMLGRCLLRPRSVALSHIMEEKEPRNRGRLCNINEINTTFWVLQFIHK